jgi:hypothetical protein
LPCGNGAEGSDDIRAGQYFHSQTYLPIKPEEEGIDSDNEIDDSWVWTVRDRAWRALRWV